MTKPLSMPATTPATETLAEREPELAVARPGQAAEVASASRVPRGRRADPPSVLRHRHFRNVWIAALGSNIGSWMEAVGIQWTMAQITLSPGWKAEHPALSAPVMMGWLATAQFFPTLALGLYGGVVADRVNRRTLLLCSQIALMLIAGVLAGLSAGGWLSPWLLMAIGGCNGVVMAFNIPAWQVLTPRLVPREELTRAITLNGMQFNLSRVVGPALGGLLLGASGPTVLFLINALSFLGVVLAVMFTPDAPVASRDESKPWVQIARSVRYALTTKGPANLIFATVLFSMLGTPLLRMLPLLVAQVYGLEEGAYGSLLAIMGAGAVIGGLALRYVPAWYPKHHFVPLSVMLGGVSIVAFAAASSATVAAIAIFVVGFFWMWAFNPAFAALQLLVSDRQRGRVLSIASTLSFGVMPLGALAAGWISYAYSGRSDDGVGVQVGIGTLAGVLTLAGLVMLIWRTPEVDGLRPGDPGYDRRPGLMRGLTARAHRPDRTIARGRSDVSDSSDPTPMVSNPADEPL
jgi:MFS family permease